MNNIASPAILPIVVYGNPVLRQKALDIGPDYPRWQNLLADMFSTMDNAKGVGLAAPQVGLPARVFVVDAEPMNDLDEHQDLTGFRRAFINARIVARWGDEWGFEEGCLSIPGLRETVFRPDWIRISYLDAELQPQTAEFRGIISRIIQHEHDHIEGVLFTDHLSALKKQLIRSKLARIQKGNVEAEYPIKLNL